MNWTIPGGGERQARAVRMHLGSACFLVDFGLKFLDRAVAEFHFFQIFNLFWAIHISFDCLLLGLWNF